VLKAVVGEERATTAASPASSSAVEDADDTGLDADEAAEVEEHLRGLGYLE
jgi:hypothetical protein